MIESGPVGQEGVGDSPSPCFRNLLGGYMSQKKLLIMVLAVMVALAAALLSSFAQAPQGQQPPADGQRGAARLRHRRR